MLNVSYLSHIKYYVCSLVCNRLSKIGLLNCLVNCWPFCHISYNLPPQNQFLQTILHTEYLACSTHAVNEVYIDDLYT